MRKFSLFMLMAVGLLISTTMSAAPERPVPPEPQGPEGIEMPVLKGKMESPRLGEALPENPATSISKAPKKAPMEDVMLTVYRGGESIDYPYTNEGLAAFQTEMADGDSIVLKRNVSTFFNIEKSVVLNLNEYYLYSTSDYVLDVSSGNVKIMNGDLYGGTTYGIYVEPTMGNVVIEGITMYYDYAPTYAIVYQGGDSLTINQCVIYGKYGVYDFNKTSKGVVSINGEDTYIFGKWYPFYFDANTTSKIIVNSGTFESPYNIVYANTSTTDSLIINGGTLHSTAQASYPLIRQAGTTIVNGGLFVVEGTNYEFSSGTQVLHGGTFQKNTFALEPGYVFVKNADGTYTVKKSVASVEGSDATFETLADAIAAAPENGIVTMLVGVNEQVTVNKPLTICTTNSSAPSTTVVFSGKITADGAKVILKGTGSIAAFEEINGGKIEIVSGTFVQDPSQNLAKGSKVLDGTEYKVSPVAATIGDVQYMSLQDAFTNAVSGDVIVVANDLEDVITSGAYVTFNQDKTITLDLNGKRVNLLVDDQLQGASHYFVNQSKGNLTITDSNADERGYIGFEVVNSKTLGSTGEYMFRVAGTAVLNINGGTLVSKTKTGCVIANNIELCSKTAVCNVTGGTIVAQGMANCARVTAGTFNISGGHFIVSEDNGNAIIFVQEDNAKQENPIVSINITGGTFENLYATGVVICCWANGNNQLQNVKVDISGGMFGSRVILFTANGAGTYWGGDDWERENWNNIYRDIFHATGGQFADGNFSINGSVDGVSISYTKSLAEILDSNYNLKDNTQISEDYPFTVGPKEITESTGDGNWNDLFPDSETKNIEIEHQVTVIEGYTKAYSLNVQPSGEVIVKNGATLDLTWGLVMEDGGSMTVEPGATLKVGVAGIQNTSSSRIVVQTNQTNSAIVSFDPDAFLFSDPYIRVEYTTSAYKSTKGDNTWYKWQDIGIPTRVAPNWIAKEATTSIKRWNAENSEYEPVTTTTFNEPFRGYIITNQLSEPGYKYIMSGRMVAAENKKFNFKVANDPNQENFNFFANSFLTPMDIKTFLQGISDEDDDIIDRTVHVFNSEDDKYEAVNLATLKIAGLAKFSTIAPMQGFYMSTKHNVEASATLNYRNSVWGQTSTAPLRAPQHINSDANVFNLYAGIGMAKDKLTFIESDGFTTEYENGYDAVKRMNEDFNIFVATERGKQSIVATDLLEGTILTFQAGDAIEYQLSFDKVQCDEYSIVDLMTGSVIEVGEGNTYSFIAVPQSTEERFQIIRKTPWVATDVDKVADQQKSKGVYTILGQYVGSSADWNRLASGVYIIDGVKIVK